MMQKTLDVVSQRRTTSAPHGAAPVTRIATSVAAACARVAPCWPLADFVAVNPYLGLLEMRFGDAAHYLECLAGTASTLPRWEYDAALSSGRMGPSDVTWAARAEGGEQRLRAGSAARSGPRPITVASALSCATRIDWERAMVDHISSWAAHRFALPRGASPFAGDGILRGFLEEATLDRGPEILGVKGFRQTIADLPSDRAALIEAVVMELGVPHGEALTRYLHRLLIAVNGWAAHARYRDWEADRAGREGSALRDLLAITLAWEVALHRGVASPSFRKQWPTRAADAANLGEIGEGLGERLCLQSAYEHAFHRRLLHQLSAGRIVRPTTRARAQLAFCIDVRSEPFRRALEQEAPGVVTIGVAGFFLLACELRSARTSTKQCPVLLRPRYVLETSERPETLTDTWARLLGAYAQTGNGAFGYVESFGLGYAAKLLMKSVPRSRPSRDRPIATASQLLDLDGHPVTVAQRADFAETLLRTMFLSRDLARLVVLVGHTSASTNNPYAHALDCGACGGHSGEHNARAAAAILNDGDVRRALRSRGLEIPDDTLFLAGLHNTAHDTVRLLDEGAIPASHRDEVAVLNARLAKAGTRVRSERAERMSTSPEDLTLRSRDWSEPRPELGLANCAAFIVAPRARTHATSLEGRAFLHDYDRAADEGFKTLELIMTAPMIVASWISLQYYASSVDNALFGSGNKTLHNVVGDIGVLEGSAGDLRTGLPEQSVLNGRRLHEPMRLAVIIDAPVDAINAIIAKHTTVRQLVDNRWLHLFAIGDDGETLRYAGDLRWQVEDGEVRA